MKSFLKPAVLFISLCAVIGPVYANERPLKVFILAGQSNMQGHAHIRTFEALEKSPEATPWLTKFQTEDGQHRIYHDVIISYLSSNGVKTGPLSAGFGADENKIGPELSFGITIAESLNEPILIIKTAWGGKSLNTDFRPPSAGLYQFNKEQVEQFRKQEKNLETLESEVHQASGVYYRAMITHVQSVLAEIEKVHPAYDARVGYELAGFVWFQGWNDMVDSGTYPRRSETGGYAQYSELLETMIRDLRMDLECPKLPFVIGVLGVGGPVSKYSDSQKRYAKIHQEFRDAMAAPSKKAEFEGNVVNVLTENCWDSELSASREREAQIKQMVRDLVSEGLLAEDQKASKERELRNAMLNDREKFLLEKGVSNFEFHYLGSAKIMACIGKSFATALLPMLH